MGRRPHKYSPNWVSAKIRRSLRDGSDESHYNEQMGDEDLSANSLPISASGDDRSESNPSIR